MIAGYEKIDNFINEKNFSKAQNLLISIIDNQILSNQSAIEDFFSYLTILHGQRKALPYLNINKVPPKPIDLNFDLGRRFFFYLQILNIYGGKKLIYPYLEGITLTRPLQFRFMGSMYHINNDFNRAKNFYQEGLDLVIKKDNFSYLHHPQMFNNFLAGCIYTLDFSRFWDSIDKFSKISQLDKTSYKLLCEQYKTLALAMEGNIKESKKKYESIYVHDFTEKIPATFSYIQALTKGIFKIQNNEPDTVDFIKSCGDEIYSHMIKNEIGPTKYFSFFYFFEAFYQKKFNFIVGNKYYPIQSFKILNQEFGSISFKELGDSSSPFFINIQTEEYSLGEGLSIRLPSEVKSIYYLVLAGDTGLNPEELSSLIHDELDYSGLFLINNRVKQITHRIKTKYKIPCSKKNGRIFLDKTLREKIRLLKTPILTIKDEFNMIELCEHYKFSKSKALKTIKVFLDQNLIIKDGSIFKKVNT
jgi:hypothetical protein